MALFKTAENGIFVFFVPIAVCTIYSYVMLIKFVFQNIGYLDVNIIFFS